MLLSLRIISAQIILCTAIVTTCCDGVTNPTCNGVFIIISKELVSKLFMDANIALSSSGKFQGHSLDDDHLLQIFQCGLVSLDFIFIMFVVTLP